MATKGGSLKSGQTAAPTTQKVAPRPTTQSDYKGGAKTIGPAAAVTNIANVTGRANPTPLGNIAQNPATGEMYEIGSFNDPNIDWQAIYNTFIAPQSSGGGSSTDYGGTTSAPAAVAAPVIPAQYQAPAQYTAPSVQAPAAVTGTAEGVVGAPSGLNFESIGTGGNTFGMFDRMRQARSPRNDLSVTPEMLKAAARARLGSL